MKPKVIITGGAGYLGGATAFILESQGYEPIVVDDYSSSRPHKNFPFPVLQVDLKKRSEVEKAWNQISGAVGVIHFAAKALVPESMAQPGLYFENNILAALNCVEVSLERGITHFVHSSTCAVYGVPKQIPIPEDHPHAPISPYGVSKSMVESMLASYASTKGLVALNLRYFNPGGALSGARWGENHEPETHLIPNLIRFAERNEPVVIFGNDYPTPDGTCIRDYIHVEDLAMAHVQALKYLNQSENPVRAMNLGRGDGYSVSQVIAATEKVMMKKLTTVVKPRRPGDAPKLVADATLMKNELGFSPRGDLEGMLRSQWEWFKANNP